MTDKQNNKGWVPGEMIELNHTPNITIRQFAAVIAMHGILMESPSLQEDLIAKYAIAIADALIEELGK